MIVRNFDFVRPGIGFLSKRFVVIPAAGKNARRRRNVRNTRKDVSLDELELDNKMDLNDPRELEFKLRQLREFTKNLQAQIRVADGVTKKEAAQQEMQDNGLSDEKEAQDTASLILSANTRDMRSTHDEVNLSNFILSAPGQAKKFLPQVLLERINDNELVLKSLINYRHRNWNILISKLHDCPEKLRGVSKRSLNTFLLSKINHISLESVQRLDFMLTDYVDNDDTKLTTAMYECLFLNLSNIKTAKNATTASKVLAHMETLLQRFDKAQNSEPEGQAMAQMNQFILNCCTKFASQVVDSSKMNYFLTKFREDYNILPNRENYTTIVQYYTKLGLGKQAWDVFATMKFLSAAHRPDAKTYASMLELCAKEKNYARAIDLYNEMTDLKIDPSTESLNALAKTLAITSGDPVSSEGKGESLRLLGWKYLHQNDDLVNLRGRNLESTIMTMMTLCAYDGDVGLARALYYKYITAKFADNLHRWKVKFGDTRNIDYKYIWMKSLNPFLFNYLMLAYANFLPNKLPLLMGFDKGAITRRNLINSVDYEHKFDQSENGVLGRLPMLPVSHLNSSTQILAESRAVWQFNLEFGGTVDIRAYPEHVSKSINQLLSSTSSLEGFTFDMLRQIADWKSNLINQNVLNIISLSSYLTIPIKLGDKTEFLLRFSEFSYDQQQLNDQISNVFTQTKRATLPSSLEFSQQVTGDSEAVGVGGSTNAAKFLYFLKHKVLRNSVLYEVAMKAAIKFKDVDLAKKTWESRGAFRKSSAFQRLAPNDRAAKDRTFAALMVDFFTSQEMYTDAMGIIMSSQRHIDWSYSMVKMLHNKLLEIEDGTSIRILLEIVNKRTKPGYKGAIGSN
ncbi:LADA_0G04236g1_1 [Lachancea dasiensis]|uniref:LADA_0G04236g1_1 n=1 Tax=Lachancea dasiensis TaxID=1072105 RepID=A0A1G4JS16_9SACH|nr:LADA_0G04236g1_1 [Lachancea dasiensis]